jgi:hypothetical protein
MVPPRIRVATGPAPSLKDFSRPAYPNAENRIALILLGIPKLVRFD